MLQRYGFLVRPKWIAFHVLVIVGIIAMINLGFWQLRRLDERQEFNATIEQRYDAAPSPLDALLSEPLDEIEWLPVEVTGEFIVDDEIRIVNRSQNGQAGENVVNPLVLDDGRVLLVNRGFVPLRVETTPPAPAGTVAVTGRIRLSQERSLGQLSDPAEGALDVAQRVDIDRLAPQLPGDVVPVYIDMISSTPPARVDGIPQPVAKPDLSEGNHLSYAVQWFIFAIAVAVGWVLAVRRSISTRREGDADAAGVVGDGEHHVGDRQPS